MFRMRRQFAWFVAIAAVLASVAIAAADDGGEFFEKRIRPLLAGRCYECHGASEQEHGLRLDSPQAIFAGGKAGAAVVPGKPDASLLIAAVRHVDEDLQMPPDEKLSDAEIADLVRWVEMGAVTGEKVDAPRSASPDAEAEKFWAFESPSRPPLPVVRDAAWPQTAIDRFILAKLEAHELSPATPAEKRALIRRATYDLIGLPPTPDEVAAFAADDSPGAFARLVDRLLAAPQYGERWGRHWLDVARYADSNGLDENICHGNAWRYRDYVVAAFNRDKPYDEFVREQLAGDLLPAADPGERNEQLIATGLLALGPKVLAEVDERKMEMDIVDEQLDTIGKSLVGLTLGCARCHDHKFDPISTRDYYALAGIFKSTQTMESFTKIARWHENPLADSAYDTAKAEHKARLAARKRELDELLTAAKAKLQAELGQAAALPEKPEESFPPATRDQLQGLREAIAALEKAPPAAPSAMGVREGTVADVPVHLRGSHLTLGEIAPRGFPEILRAAHMPAISPQASGRLELAQWLTDPRHPLTSRVIVNRVWRWHFGRGLVATPDNFGQLGERPSHPELLNWLAVELAASGWSLKQLHRTIMLSATYQMASSVENPRAKLIDPQNRLLWRANMRRLEAEEIRDAMLAVGGELDLAQGGSLLTVENRAFFFDHTSKDNTAYDTRRRSVYLPVVRNHLADSFTLFDYADAAMLHGDRPTSTVASQALYLLNSDFAATSAEGFARRILNDTSASDAERVDNVFAIAFGRPATAEETERARAFLAYCADELRAGEASQPLGDARRLECWRLLCQTLLMSNEFLYLQ